MTAPCVSTAAATAAAAPSWRLRALALLIGLVNHSLFLSAIGSMALALWTGMNLGRGTFEGTALILANLTLVLQFPLIHSALLSKRGTRLLTSLFPAPHGRTLVTTTYGHWTKDEPPYIMSVRLKLAELDAMAKPAKK